MLLVSLWAQVHSLYTSVKKEKIHLSKARFVYPILGSTSQSASSIINLHDVNPSRLLLNYTVGTKLRNGLKEDRF